MPVEVPGDSLTSAPGAPRGEKAGKRSGRSEKLGESRGESAPAESLAAAPDPFRERAERLAREHPEARIMCFALVESNTDALALFEAVRSAGLPARIAPAPPERRSACGIAVMLDAADEPRLRQVAAQASVTLSATVPGIRRHVRRPGP